MQPLINQLQDSALILSKQYAMIERTSHSLFNLLNFECDKVLRDHDLLDYHGEALTYHQESFVSERFDDLPSATRVQISHTVHNYIR